ncbi:MAG TPA: hypothetical protein VFU99_09195 [Gaiellaceae bacterium]|nr:hypothetical protein [Gaiellaceae bacterium]
MRRFLPLLVALGLVALVVVPYLALGGGRYEPTPVADPCGARERPDAEGLGETLERIALRALDGVACELGVTREDLVLALRSEEALDAFSREQGLDRAELEETISAGLVRAVDDAEREGALPSLVAPLVRRAAESVPPWLILETLERLGGFFPG